jgi:hypothetical protein
MGEISRKIADNLYLIEQAVPSKTKAKPAVVPTNHIAVIDCSGSMSYDLPKIREQLKRKIPKLLGDEDTLSIVWFSGRGQFGTLLEAEPVSTLADLQQVNQAIDRWLKPVCLTGFKEPMEEVARLVERVGKKHPGAFALFFQSDGHDNQWSRAEILKAVEKAAGGLSAATFVEYGYYADRPLLAAMAEKAGGSLIFSEDFDRYAPQFEAAMQKKPSGGKRVEVPVSGDVVGGFAFAMQDGDLLTFAVEAGKAQVPEGVSSVWRLAPAPIGTVAAGIGDEAKAAAYAAMSLFSVRMKPEVVLPILKVLGDVAFIERFGGLFGKQKYSEFMEEAKTAAFDGNKRLVKGYDPSRVPADDAFTVLDLLQLLASDDNNRVLMEHPDFKYSAIGRGRIDASDQLTAEEQEEIEKLTSQIASEKKNVKKISELTAKIAAITAGKQPALKFESEPAPHGYAISNLTYNEDRPNISILVKKSGNVDLSSRVTEELDGTFPDNFPTFVYRNYAIVKDGLVNVGKLPVTISAATYEKLATVGVRDCSGREPSNTDAVVDMVIDVAALPVINRKMVRSVSAKEFFSTKYELSKARAAQKVFNSFSKELLPPKKAEGFAATYGDVAAEWLKEQGITDYSGFSPKSVQAESTDFYMGKELKVSLKGLSSLPSLKDLRTQIAKGKLNVGGQLMKPSFDRVEAFLKSDVYTGAADRDGVLKAWLEGETKAAKLQARHLIHKIAQTTFCIVVGQSWFSEFSSLDENSMDIDVDGKTVSCKVEMKDIQIKI